MGLIRAAAGALGGTLADQWKEYFYCEAMDSDVLAGKLIYLRNVSKDAGFQYPSNAKDEGLVSVLSAPLTVEGRPIGILRVYASEERDFSDEEKEFLKGVANISAIAIENARMTEALRCKYDLLTTYNYQIYED